MGFENDNLMYPGGMPITMELLPEISYPKENAEPEQIPCLQPMEFTLHIKPTKRGRCGNRKRYVKLMMSEGFTRNEAQCLASVIQRNKIPYREAWSDYLLRMYYRIIIYKENHLPAREKAAPS